MPSLPRQGRPSSRLKDFEHSIGDPKIFKTIEEKYKSLYLQIVETNLDEIISRFADESIGPVLSIARLIKFGELEEFKKIRDLNIYNHLIDFNQLEREVKLWPHSLAPYKNNKDYNLKKVSSIIELFVNKVIMILYF